MIRNSRTASEGELLIRRMNEKAQKYYSGADCIKVYANDRNDNEGIYMSFDFGKTIEKYTFEQVENDLISLQEMFEEIMGG